MENGTKLIYVRQDSGLVTDTGVYLAPGEGNAVVVGTHLNAELAEAFLGRGWCAVHAPEPSETLISEKAGSLSVETVIAGKRSDPTGQAQAE